MCLRMLCKRTDGGIYIDNQERGGMQLIAPGQDQVTADRPYSLHLSVLLQRPGGLGVPILGTLR
jgi:hypothetical protein